MKSSFQGSARSVARSIETKDRGRFNVNRTPLFARNDDSNRRGSPTSSCSPNKLLLLLHFARLPCHAQTRSLQLPIQPSRPNPPNPHNSDQMAGARLHRLARELELLRNDPPPGVAAWLVDEADISRFHASTYTKGWGTGLVGCGPLRLIQSSAHMTMPAIQFHRHPGARGHAVRGRRLPPRAGALGAVREQQEQQQQQEGSRSCGMNEVHVRVCLFN